MIKQWISHALAAGVDAGDEEVARTTLRRCDPLLRPLARRKLERLILDAMLDTESIGGGSTRTAQASVALVLRRARLTLHRHAMDPRSVEELELAYDQLPAPRPLRFPLVSLLVSLAVAGSTAMAVMALRPPADARAFVRARPPVSEGAFTHGGTPPGDPRLDVFFSEVVTDAVIALDHVRDGGNAQAERALATARLLTADVLGIMGSPLDQEWQKFVAALVELSSGSDLGQDESIFESAGSVSDHFAHRGLGYYVDASVWAEGNGRIHAIPYVYRVEEVRFVTAGTMRQRVLNLRRLDRVNRSRAVLGMQSEHLSDPVVLLDRVERNVSRDLIPMLAGIADLEKDVWHRTAAGIETGTVIQQALGDELKEALPADAERLEKMLGLYEERVDLWDSWRSELEQRGMRLAELTSVMLPADAYDWLSRWVVKPELERGRAIEQELLAAETPRLAAHLEDLLVASVRRHEAQHALDDQADDLRYPAELEKLLGPAEAGSGRSRIVRRKTLSARAELSAYLSQIASDPKTPKAVLSMLTGHALNQGSWGSAECYAALVALEAIAHELRLPVEPGWIAHGGIDRDRVAPTFVAVLGTDAARLRAAAATAWTRLFGKPLPPIVDS